MKSRSLNAVIREKHTGKTGRIIVLTGARQTGKTTLSRFCFPDYHYISLDDPLLRYTYKELSAQQWHKFYPRAILDEVQKEPQLVESVKAVFDLYPDVRYILTGSSQLLLLQKVKESLAGRCSIFELFPLTIPEMVTTSRDEPVRPSFFQELILGRELSGFMPSFTLYPDFPLRQKSFNDYLRFGGYPVLIDPSMKEEEKWDWLTGYVRTYLERDIRDIADFRYLEPFVKLQKASALMTGELVNFTSLARQAGVTPNTARNYLNYLEISYQTILLQPWYKNELKRLSKSPKIHFLDTGVLRAILRNKGELSGRQFESAVIAEMVKQIRTLPDSASFYHLRTLDGREVDFLLELANGYFAFEIKMTGNVHATDVRHLVGLDGFLDKPLLGCFILSNDHTIRRLGENITALPAAMFLS